MKVSIETRKKRRCAPLGEGLAALIGSLAETVASTGHSLNLQPLWARAVTLLLRLCAVRLTHRSADWTDLFERVYALLNAPLTDASLGRSAVSVQTINPNILVAVDSLLEPFGTMEHTQVLSQIYEAVLNMVPVLEARNGYGVKLIARQRDHSKKRAGSFYSPPHLVSRVIESALDGIVAKPVDVESLKIVDPAMGAGVFLVYVLKFLRDRFKTDAKVIARDVLHGVDLDPLAVEVARLSLWMEVGDYSLLPATEFSNLRVGNSLIGCRLDQISTGSLSALKERLDGWCENWFGISSAERQKFFHWEFEFPKVFSPERVKPGFDVVLGNPPWEIEKPNSREFFGAVFPEYWELGKQEALAVQDRLLRDDANLAAIWSERNEDHKRFTKWVKNAPVQCDEKQHPFQFQGAGDTNLYKLFCEQSFYLARNGGRVALVVPAGIYSDSGARDLRRLLIEQNNWIRLIGFENSDSTFDIHRSFKYCIFVADKGGATRSIETNFYGSDSEQEVSSIAALSPKWFILPEAESRKSFQLIEKIYSRARVLGGAEFGGMKMEYRREFDMTLDSKLFHARDQLERNGYVQDCYGNWLLGKWRSGNTLAKNSSSEILSFDGERFVLLDDVVDVFVPLYEGRMVGQFDSNEKRWISGRGRRSVWQRTSQIDRGIHLVSNNETNSDASFHSPRLGPQYLVNKTLFLQRCSPNGLKIGFLAVGSATNARTMIATALPAVACGNSVPVLWLAGDSGVEYLLSPIETTLAITGFLNSFIFDYVIRRKMAGNNLNYYVIEECPIPVLNQSNAYLWKHLAQLVGSLALSDLRFCRELSSLNLSVVPRLGESGATIQERQMMRTCADLIAARLYGLSSKDLRFLLEESLVDGRKSVKGFHRVDRDLPADMRLPARVLALAHCLDASEKQFCEEIQSSVLSLLRTSPYLQSVDLQRHALLLNALIGS